MTDDILCLIEIYGAVTTDSCLFAIYRRNG